MRMIAIPVVSALGSWLWVWLATLSGAVLMSGVSFASEGATVDISTQALAAREIDWLRTMLRGLTAERMVHAIEEFNEPHFHVLVRKRYGTYAAGFRSPMFRGGC